MKKAKIVYITRIGGKQSIHEVEATVIGVVVKNNKTRLVFVTIGLGFVVEISINDVITCKFIENEFEN